MLMHLLIPNNLTLGRQLPVGLVHIHPCDIVIIHEKYPCFYMTRWMVGNRDLEPHLLIEHDAYLSHRCCLLVNFSKKILVWSLLSNSSSALRACIVCRTVAPKLYTTLLVFDQVTCLSGDRPVKVENKK